MGTVQPGDVGGLEVGDLRGVGEMSGGQDDGDVDGSVPSAGTVSSVTVSAVGVSSVDGSMDSGSVGVSSVDGGVDSDSVGSVGYGGVGDGYGVSVLQGGDVMGVGEVAGGEDDGDVDGSVPDAVAVSTVSVSAMGGGDRRVSAMDGSGMGVET